MCKYCKMVTLLEECGEKSNERQPIDSIIDGSQTIRLSLNRYAVESDDHHVNELIMESTVEEFYGDRFIVNYTAIPIKYCPFCGEEL